MSEAGGAPLHAGLIAAWRRGQWRGVLIEGPSGCGKSDLALRALEQGFRLVADDRAVLWISAGRLFGRAPPTLAGLMEIRGLEVVALPRLALVEVALVVRHGRPERIPRRRLATVQGAAIPLLELDLLEASSPAKLSRALDLFDGGRNRRI